MVFTTHFAKNIWETKMLMLNCGEINVLLLCFFKFFYIFEFFIKNKKWTLSKAHRKIIIKELLEKIRIWCLKINTLCIKTHKIEETKSVHWNKLIMLVHILQEKWEINGQSIQPKRRVKTNK